MLPPRERRAAEVLSLRSDPAFGLPAARRPSPAGPYKAELQLDYVGQPTVAVGADPFGTYVGGGVSMFFSDMLGNHSLGGIVQVNGSFEDFGGHRRLREPEAALGLGRGRRADPLPHGVVRARGREVVNGEPAFVEQQLLFRQTNRALRAFVAYPFSRSRRVELGGAFRQHLVQADAGDAGLLAGHGPAHPRREGGPACPREP